MQIAANVTTHKEYEMNGATVANRSILVTGANRGIGQALVAVNQWPAGVTQKRHRVGSSLVLK